MPYHRIRKVYMQYFNEVDFAPNDETTKQKFGIDEKRWTNYPLRVPR